MQIAVKTAIFMVLALIFAQDKNNRSVWWVFFPLLSVLLISLRLLRAEPALTIVNGFLSSAAFLLLQLLLVSIYFSIKNRAWVNITKELLGWGDILFLICAAFYLSLLNFVFFYSISLLAVLLFWLTRQWITGKQDRQIPLAGLQAVLFLVFLAGSWLFPRIDPLNDNWLLTILV